MTRFLTWDWNPLFLRELRVTVRERRVRGRAWWLAAMLSLPALVLLAAQTASPGALTNAGRLALMAYGLIQNLLAMVLVPIAAGGIVVEREKNTYEVLQASPLSPERLFRGKLFFATWTALSFQALLVPAMSVLYLSGGFPYYVVPAYFVLLAANDLALAALCLLISAQPHRTPSIAMGAVKHLASRVQVALQKAMGAVVCFFVLIPTYAVIIPLALGIAASATRTASPMGEAEQVIAAIGLLGALSPMVALSYWGDLEVFGVPIPIGLLTIAVNLLLAGTFTAFGIAQLRGRERDRSIAGRTLLAVTVIGVAALLLGGQPPGTAGPFISVIVLTLLFLLLLAPTHSAAEPTRAEKAGYGGEVRRNGLSLSGLFRGRISSAPFYLGLLAASLYPLLRPMFGADAFPVCATLVATTVGLGLLGNRVALTRLETPGGGGPLAGATFAFFVACTMVPLLAAKAAQATEHPAFDAAAGALSAGLLPLNPLATLLLRLAATHGAANRELQGLRAAAGALAPSAWAITCGCYLAVGLACALWPRKAPKAAKAA